VSDTVKVLPRKRRDGSQIPDSTLFVLMRALMRKVQGRFLYL